MRMSITQRAPWALMPRLDREMDRLLFDRPARQATRDGHFVPPVDVTEHADRYELRADLPGIDTDATEITLDDGVLLLTGVRRRLAAEVESQQLLLRSERTHGSFRRRFRLPDAAAEDGLEAEYSDGVLTITIPKKARPQPHRVEVEAH